MSTDANLAAASQKYGVPLTVLRSIGLQESGLNPNTGNSTIAPAVGTERATGMMQIKPSTARGLGVDPSDPAQSIDGAAKYLSQGYKQFGNWDDAVRFYHGGPNTKLWGPRTQKYHEEVAGKIASGTKQPAPSDPFEAIMAEHTNAAPPAAPANPQHDAYEAAMADAMGGGNAGLPNNDSESGGNRGGDQGRPDSPVMPDIRDPGSERGWLAKAASLDPGLDSIVNGTNYLGNIQDASAGMLRGALKVPETLLHGAAGAIDLTGTGHKTADTLRNWSDGIDTWAGGLAANPGSNIAKSRELAGSIAATLPVSEINLLRAGEGAGALAQGLARYGNMSLQGGAGGALASGGKDVKQNALAGAVLAPALGAVVSKFGAPVIGAMKKMGGAKLAAAVRNAGREAAPELATAETGAAKTIRTGADFGGMKTDPKTGKSYLEVEVSDEAPAVAEAVAPKAAPADIAAALGSRGQRSGVEAIQDVPSDVAEHFQRLKKEGVSPEQAMREAEMLGVGAKPTVATSTRSPEEMSAMFEGAKQATPEGRALAARIAENNAAVHATLQDTVQAYGGVPARGQAAEGAARSLAKASDAERVKVADLYTKARAAEGDARVSIDPLRELLATPKFKAPTTAEARDLIKGIRTLSRQMSEQNRNRFTPDEIESLRQAANAAYDPMGGRANSLVGEIKSALDASLNELEAAGPAYKAARAAHRGWAKAYDDPQGIAKLIRRDAEGNFLKDDNWRAAEGFVGSIGDKDFIQIVRQLKATGDTEALNRMKANIVQRAYDKATNTAADKLGNATVSGKAFFAELDKIGKPKLEALFEKDEIAKLASTGRAAKHLNEAVPGSVNTSSTSSALVKAIQGMGVKPSGKLKTAARVFGHGVGAVTGHLGGNVAVEVGHKAVNAAAERTSAKALAKALRETMDTGAARQSAKDEAKRIAEIMLNKAKAKHAADRLAPVAGPAQDRRQ